MAERGLTLRVGGLALATGMVELLAGDLEAAEEAYADGIKVLESIGEKGVRSTVAAMQAWTQYRVGRPDEALASIELAKETGASYDIATQAGWRNTAAMIAADRGDLATAERLIGEARAMVEPTDFLELRGQTWEALAHVHRRTGRLAEAETALRRAMSEHDRKGNLMELARVEGLLETSSPGPEGLAPPATRP
jgi:tetratricopeptide (TPR) repeat protein